MVITKKRGNRLVDCIKAAVQDDLGRFNCNRFLFQHLRYTISQKLEADGFPSWVIFIINEAPLEEYPPGSGHVMFNFSRHQRILLREFDYEYEETDEQLPSWREETEENLY